MALKFTAESKIKFEDDPSLRVTLPWFRMAVIAAAIFALSSFLIGQHIDPNWAGVQRQAAEQRAQAIRAELDNARREMFFLAVPPGEVEETIAAYSKKPLAEIQMFVTDLQLEQLYRKRDREAYNELYMATHGAELQAAKRYWFGIPDSIFKDKYFWLIGGMVAAFLMTSPIELRRSRPAQLVFIPTCLSAMHYLIKPTVSIHETSLVDLFDFIALIPFVITMAIILGPNIVYCCTRAIENILDPQDWHSRYAEINLFTVQRLISEDKFTEALHELDLLLKKHHPTYEALFLRTKLLHHFNRNVEARDNAFAMLRLAQSDGQQATIMAALREMKSRSS